VCAGSAGYEAVDLDAARRRGIVVAHCPNANATAVADSAMMLLLAATRHLLEANRFVRAGGWQEHWRVRTPLFSSNSPGTLGLGRIGSRIAQRAARGFDMDIGYHPRTAVAGCPYRYFASLLELAAWADFLVAAAPGGMGTRHLINADVLAALGPHGYLVNVGRGTVVDTQALIEALRAKRLAGAGPEGLGGGASGPATTSGAAARRQRRGHATRRRARAGVAERGDRDDSGQPERTFCGPAAALAGRTPGLSSHPVVTPTRARGNTATEGWGM